MPTRTTDKTLLNDLPISSSLDQLSNFSSNLQTGLILKNFVVHDFISVKLKSLITALIRTSKGKFLAMAS